MARLSVRTVGTILAGIVGLLGPSTAVCAQEASVAQVYDKAVRQLSQIDDEQRAALEKAARGVNYVIVQEAQDVLHSVDHDRRRRAVVRAARRNESAIDGSWEDCVLGNPAQRAIPVAKQLAIMLMADANMRLALDDCDRAADNYAAAFGIISQYAKSPGFRGIATVGFIVVRYIQPSLEQAIDQGLLTSDNGRVILAAIDRINMSDPVNTVMRMSNLISVYTSEYRRAVEAGRLEDIALIIRRNRGATIPEHITHQSLTQLEQSLEKLKLTIESAKGFAVDEDSVQRAKVAVDGYIAEENGSLAPWLSSIPNWLHSSNLTRQRLHPLRTRVEKLVREGRTKSQNAAYLYVRAASELSELDQSTVEDVIDGTLEVDEDLRRQLDRCLGAFQVASEIERCDFVPIRSSVEYPSTSITLFHKYCLRMVDAVRLMLAEVSRMSRDADAIDGAVYNAKRVEELLLASYRIVNDIAADRWITSSAIAHLGYSSTCAVVEREWGRLSVDQRQRIRVAMQSFSGNDNFVYAGAIDESRKELTAALQDLMYRMLIRQQDPKEWSIEKHRATAALQQERNAAIQSSVDSMSTGKLSSWLVVLDLMGRVGLRGEEFAGASVDSHGEEIYQLPLHPWIGRIVDVEGVKECAGSAMLTLPMVLLDWEDIWKVDLTEVLAVRELQRESSFTLQEVSRWLDAN